MFNPGFGFTGNQGHPRSDDFVAAIDAFHHCPPNQAEELSLHGFNRPHQNGSSCTLAFFSARSSLPRQISIRRADTDFRQGAVLVLSKRDFRKQAVRYCRNHRPDQRQSPAGWLPQRTVTLSPAPAPHRWFIRPRRPLPGFKVSTRNTACPVACPVLPDIHRTVTGNKCVLCAGPQRGGGGLTEIIVVSGTLPRHRVNRKPLPDTLPYRGKDVFPKVPARGMCPRWSQYRQSPACRCGSS